MLLAETGKTTGAEHAWSFTEIANSNANPVVTHHETAVSHIA